MVPIGPVMTGLVLVLVSAVSACGSALPATEMRSAPRPSPSAATAPPVPTPVPPSIPPTAPPTIFEPSPTPPPPPTVPTVTAIPTDQDGRIFGLVVDADDDARTLTVDVATYLSGDEYHRWLAADPSRWGELDCGDTGTYDGTQDLSGCGPFSQDQTVVNENDRLRTLSLRSDATYTVPLGTSGEPSPVDLSEFVDYVRSGMQMGDAFFLTVHDGWVTDVEFQFFS